jgi:hypothetical protein
VGLFGSLFRSSPPAKGIHGTPGALPALAQSVQRIMEQRIAILEESPSYPALRAAHLTIKGQAAVQAAVAPREKAWSQALWWGAMCSEALLQCAHPAETEIYFNREITVPRAEKPAPGLARVWREGFQMAVLATYDELARAIQRFNLDRLRTLDSDSDEAELLYAHALQGLYSNAPDLGDRLLAAVNQITRGDADDYVLRLLGAEAECLYAVVIDEPAQLRTALAKGLEEHHKYWTADKRDTNVEGLFSLGLSYVARLATRGGMRVDVKSPYLVY